MQIAEAQLPLLLRMWNAGIPAVDVGRELGLEGSPQEIRLIVLTALERANQKPERPARIKLPAKAKAPNKRKVPRTEDDDRFGESDGITDSTDATDLQIPEDQRRRFARTQEEVGVVKEPAIGFCCWPIGEVGPDMFFCGAPSKTGSSYCPAHHRRGHTRAYAPRYAGLPAPRINF